MSRPCFYCYRTEHSSSERCPNDGLIACTKCFRVNVFSNGCNCTDRRQAEPPQVLRQIGKPKAPKWFTDVQILNRLFPAMINTSITRCQVSSAFSDWWQLVSKTKKDDNSELLMIEIQRKGRRLRVTCDIVHDLGDDIHIHLGTELLTFLGYTFTLENITIKSKHSPVLSSPYEIEYVYNLPRLGEDLRTYLSRKRHFMKKGRVTKRESYGGYTSQPTKRSIILRRSSSISSY